MTENRSVFYMLPTPINPDSRSYLSDEVVQMYHKLNYFIAENPKTARRFLAQINHPLPHNQITVHRFNKKSRAREVDQLMQPLRENTCIAYLSEAGAPAIADPGNRLVRWAHRKNITVAALPGPISLMIALSASGLNGQNFHFHGYLPIKEKELKNKIESFQKSAVKKQITHIFIETPYRSSRTLNSLLSHLHENIDLCIGMNLTMENELIKTQSISQWRETNIIEKVEDQLCVFLFAAAGAGKG